MWLSDWQSGSELAQEPRNILLGLVWSKHANSCQDCLSQGPSPSKVLPGFFFGGPVCEGAAWMDTHGVHVALYHAATAWGAG